MSTTTKEKPNTVIKKQIYKILPYIDPLTENLGLTKHNLILFDGAVQAEQITCLESPGGIRRYLTGLNEDAPEILIIQDKDEKAAAIKDIREKVIFLEKAFGSNAIEINDPKFWDKVKTVHPTNNKFWDGIVLYPSNEPVFLNPEDPHDLIKICGIQAGGFSIIAKSYEDARTMASPPKFYLDNASDTSATKNESVRIRNKAGAVLGDLFEKNPTKMLHVLKVIDKNGEQYKKATSPEILYQALNNYIEGKGSEKSMKKASQRLIEVDQMSAEDLHIKALLNDAYFYKIVQGKADGLIYHSQTDSMMGRNIEEVFKYVKNPVHSEIAASIQKEVEVYWNV